MNEKLLVVLVDGCRESYVNKINMPFTYDLYERNAHSSLKTILGYSNAIRATAFTGTLPSTHGRWCNFAHDPANSPYRDVQYLKFLDHIPIDLAKRASRFFLSKTLMKKIAGRKNYDSLELGNVPIHLLMKFDFLGTKTLSVGSQETPSFFDVLAENGVRFNYLEFPYLTRSRHLQLFRDRLRNSNVLVVYLPYLDGAAHWFGTTSKRFRRKTGYVDRLMRQLFTIASEGWGSGFDFLLFSDHGMSDVYEYIDFFEISRRWKFQHEGEGDYDVFLDSTMARFWYKDSRAKEGVEEEMSKLPGHFLSPPEMQEYGIAFNHNRYGDEVFLLDPGCVFFPCYLSWIRPKAMHGYSPADKTQEGILIIGNDSVPGGSLPEARMVDIMPTLLDMLNLPIPSSCEGNSIIARC